MARLIPPRYARMAVPGWAFDHHPESLLAETDVDVKPDPAPNTYRVQTSESYRRQTPNLVTYRHLAGSTARADFAYLDDRVDLAPHTSGDFFEQLAHKRALLEQTKNPVHALDYLRLSTLLCHTQDLGPTVESHYRELLTVPLEGNPEHKVFANAGVHLVERSPALIWRLKLPFILSQVAQDRRLKAGDVRHVMEASGEAVVFQSGNGLADGVYLMDAYLGPLLGALAPSVWCVSVPRTFGVILYSLGQPLAGTSGGPQEMLHLISGPGATTSVPVPRLAPDAGHSAIKWWAQGLNQMFGVLSDFAIFTDRQGRYLPYKHMQAIMTTEQLFRRCASAAISDRDTNARRVLMFTAMDTLERLTATKLETTARPAHAERRLARLRSEIWPDAAEVLLPTATRSTEALRELEQGFFVGPMLGDSDVRLLYADGSELVLSPDKATAFYVKALRDATHGHGSNKASARERTDALLAQHNGQIPHDLGFLSALYLLDLLTEPHRLRSVLHSWCLST